MRMTNFLSMFHFQIIHTLGEKNVVADALSRKLYVATISVASHNDLSIMCDKYDTDVDFGLIWTDLIAGHSHASYLIKDGYFMKDNGLCIIADLRHKVMDECHAPPFAGHRGIMPTTHMIERCLFYLSKGQV